MTLFGLTDFATIAPTVTAGAEFFGRHRVGTAAGLISFGHQLGSALGALIPGVLFDQALLGGVDENPIALVSDQELDAGVPRFLLDDAKGVTDFIEATFLQKDEQM